MINIKQTKKYCCEDITLIENYEKALNDNTQTWEIHHKLEIQEDGALISGKELIDNGLYWDRPAVELIFLTPTDHKKLHRIGKHHSEDTKKKMREAKKDNTYWLGKHHSKETRQKMRNNKKNKNFVKGEDGKYHWIEKNSSISLF